MNNEIQLFKKRLNDTIYENNTDAEKISKGTGIHISTIYRYINGDIKDLKMSNIFKLAEFLNISPIYLAGWSDEKHVKKEQSNIFPVTDKIVELPVLGKISAGLPLLAIENLEGHAFAPSSKLKPGIEYFYLRVQGDSMNLKFNDGDLVLVQKQDDLENDEIGVIAINGDDATVKKFKRENGLIVLQPMSTNPEHTVQIYNPKDIPIKIIGKIISYQGNV